MIRFTTKIIREISFIFKNESGAAAIEYGLIAALISVVVIAAVSTVGSKLSTTFNNIASALSATR